MTHILNKKRKKKGFTLIELVIVLAVLAIIALIAIPNFTKVRNDSLEKADKETANQIRKITLMAIADGDIKAAEGTYKVDFNDGKCIGISKTGSVEVVDKDDVAEMMKEVKEPQVNGKTTYLIKVTTSGDVAVGYPASEGTDFENEGILAE